MIDSKNKIKRRGGETEEMTFMEGEKTRRNTGGEKRMEGRWRGRDKEDKKKRGKEKAAGTTASSNNTSAGCV